MVFPSATRSERRVAIVAMQKITSHLPSWDTTKKQSKKGFDKAIKVVDKLGAPINRFSNRIGSEAFWPTTLDKESDKAARILKSFCSKSQNRGTIFSRTTSHLLVTRDLWILN